MITFAYLLVLSSFCVTLLEDTNDRKLIVGHYSFQGPGKLLCNCVVFCYAHGLWHSQECIDQMEQLLHGLEL